MDKAYAFSPLVNEERLPLLFSWFFYSHPFSYSLCFLSFLFSSRLTMFSFSSLSLRLYSVFPFSLFLSQSSDDFSPSPIKEKLPPLYMAEGSLI
jgi:hypothetical protein